MARTQPELHPGWLGIVIIVIGVLARLGGAFAALLGSLLSTNERLFVGIGTTGRATVQATLAPLVVAFGVTNGETVLAIAVMSVLTMSVLASVAIELA